ncbi:MAG: T9SS type A sorting domain-containing protein [Candidatus Zixiibacteriota bacterium]|nr:MAG: T9SS type A sorting domain-containing protein [candidate division Zixibacteria bacterium]
MMRKWLSNVLLLLIILFSYGSTSGEVYFEEWIDADSTLRLTRDTDEIGAILFREALAGNADFGIETNSVSYTHSIENIEPPILPDGTVRHVRLKLFLSSHGSDDIELVVDSLELDKISSRNFLVGPALSDTVNVSESPLGDGSIEITIAGGPDDLFILKRSVLTILYTPAVHTDVGESDSDLPLGYTLAHNYPNPFNPSTTIGYHLQERSHVRIEIFNLLGRSTRVLIDGEQSSGQHTVVWDGRTNDGSIAPTGIYFYRIITDDYTASKKMMLLK